MIVDAFENGIVNSSVLILAFIIVTSISLFDKNSDLGPAYILGSFTGLLLLAALIGSGTSTDSDKKDIKDLLLPISFGIVLGIIMYALSKINEKYQKYIVYLGVVLLSGGCPVLTYFALDGNSGTNMLVSSLVFSYVIGISFCITFFEESS